MSQLLDAGFAYPLLTPLKIPSLVPANAWELLNSRIFAAYQPGFSHLALPKISICP